MLTGLRSTLTVLVCWLVSGYGTPGAVQAASLKFCTWRSSISATIPQVQDMSARCPEGHLLWYYPSGELKVQFSTRVSRQNFKLCLKTSENYNIKRIQSGEVVIPTPTPGNETCIHSVDGKKILRFLAPTSKVYFTDIHYVITPTER